MEEEPPSKIEIWYKRFVLAVIVVCFVVVILFLFQIVFGIIGKVFNTDIPEMYQPFSFYDTQLAQWESPVLHYQVLGSLKGNLIDRIIFCESSGNPKAKNPRSSAYGLCQFIDSTWAYVEDKWDMDLDREDPIDQLYACERLLSEEGVSHWAESQCCWE